MWEKKEDPLWKNVEIAVWVSTIITIIFFWVGVLESGFNWSSVLFLVVMTMSFGVLIYYIFAFIFVIIVKEYEKIRRKSE